MRKFLCATFITVAFLASPQLLRAQSHWTYSVNNHGLKEMHIDQRATILGRSCITRLKFICTHDSKDGGASGALSMELTIAPATEIKEFNFDFFEGPDAPVGKQELMKIVLIRGATRTEFRVPVGGWASAEGEDGFSFGTSSLTRDKTGHVRKILNGILSGAESIQVSVIDGIDPTKVISASFPTAPDLQSFRELMQGLK
jgi:hypothetical protein